MTFYNTTMESGRTLESYQAKAGAQESAVMALFADMPRALYTPFDVAKAVFQDNVPITSVRRAMTNLTTAGVLAKTPHKAKGKYGRLCYTWKLHPRHVDEATQLKLF